MPGTTYEIELGMARYEAVMARANNAMAALLDGPTPRNGHLAMAVKTILDDEMQRLLKARKLLHQAWEDSGLDIREVPVSSSNGERADRTVELTGRYERHMAQFGTRLRHTEASVKLTMTLFPICNLEAVRHLNAEVITRQPGDHRREAYLHAMLEAADLIPHQKSTLEGADGDFTTPADKTMLRKAIEATDAMNAVVRPHRDNPGEAGSQQE